MLTGPTPCLSNAGQVLSCAKDNEVKILDTNKFAVLRTLESPGVSLTGAARLRYDKHTAKSLGHLALIYVFMFWAEISLDIHPCCSFDGSHAAASGGDGSAILYNVQKGSIVTRLKDDKQPFVAITDCAWGAAQNTLATCCRGGKVTLWAA